MPALPTGTVTFLFTDIEGSTRLWEQHPAAMQVALSQHDRLLREAVEDHGGHIVKLRGDGVHAVFAAAGDALAAALAAQRALAAASWPETGPLPVRMGLHTGEATLRAGDYYAPTVNRAARVAAAGSGRQILLSAATAELLRDDLPAGVRCEPRDTAPAGGPHGRPLAIAVVEFRIDIRHRYPARAGQAARTHEIAQEERRSWHSDQCAQILPWIAAWYQRRSWPIHTRSTAGCVMRRRCSGATTGGHGW
jgi:class 3 adenylate cyclase